MTNAIDVMACTSCAKPRKEGLATPVLILHRLPLAPID